MPLYADYRTPPRQHPEKGGGIRVSWRTFLDHWPWVVADLQQHYGISEYAVQDAPWPWFRTLVYGLIDIPDSRIRLHLEA